MDSSKGGQPLGYIHGTKSLIPGLEAMPADLNDLEAHDDSARPNVHFALGERLDVTPVALAMLIGVLRMIRWIDVPVMSFRLAMK